MTTTNLSKSVSFARNSRNLKEAYKKRIIYEKIIRADKIVAPMIFEAALDSKDLQMVNVMINKLREISKSAEQAQLKPIVDAIKSASDEVNKFIAGDESGVFKDVMKGAKNITKDALGSAASFLAGASASENPLTKCALLINVLEKGCDKLVLLLDNNIEGFKEQKQSDSSIKDLLGEGDEAKKALENLKKAIPKSFVAEDLWSKISSFLGSEKIPYVTDNKQFSESILSVPLKGLVDFIESITKEKIGAQLQAMTKGLVTASEEEQGGSSKRGGGSPVTTRDQLARAIAQGRADEEDMDDKKARAAQKDARKNPKKVTSEFIKYVAEKSKQEPDVVGKVVSALLKAGKLKSEFNITSESRRFIPQQNTIVLTLSDVAQARNLYLESGCSSRRWVNLLIEAKFDPKNSWKELIEKIKNKEIDNEEKINKFLKEKGADQGAIKDFKQKYKNEIKGLVKKAQAAEPEAKPKADPETNVAVQDATKATEQIEDRETVDVGQAKKIVEEMLKDVNSGIENLKSAIEGNESRGLDSDELKGLAEEANESLIDVKEKLEKLFKAEKITPEELAQASKAMILSVQKSSIYVYSASEQAIKDKEEKAAQQNAARTKELESKAEELAKKLEALAAEKEATNKKAQEKYGKLADEIVKKIEDVKPDQIIAVLDALPSYLFAEAQKKRRLIEMRRLEKLS